MAQFEKHLIKNYNLRILILSCKCQRKPPASLRYIVNKQENNKPSCWIGVKMTREASVLKLSLTGHFDPRAAGELKQGHMANIKNTRVKEQN